VIDDSIRAVCWAEQHYRGGMGGPITTSQQYPDCRRHTLCRKGYAGGQGLNDIFAGKAMPRRSALIITSQGKEQSLGEEAAQLAGCRRVANLRTLGRAQDRQPRFHGAPTPA